MELTESTTIPMVTHLMSLQRLSMVARLSYLKRFENQADSREWIGDRFECGRREKLEEDDCK